MTARLVEFSSFDELRAAVAGFEGPDAAAQQEARARQDRLTKPPGSLGRLEALAIFLAGWQGRTIPVLDQVDVLVFAGNHGVCNQGVNPYPQSVTAQMVENFETGGAAVNQLAALYDATLRVIALDLDRPTMDFSDGPAMGARETLAAINTGADAVDPAADLLVLGEMGIGNSTVAAALSLGLFGGSATDWVGPGSGNDPSALTRKQRVVEDAVERHAAAKNDPLALLAALGGREQAALLGAIVAVRLYSIPVILDGFICCAAAAPLHVLDPGALDHCLVGHRSAEPGHGRLLTALGKEPLLDLGMRLGEGTGALVALGVLRGAVACHADMATFAEAGVDDAGGALS